MDKEAILIWIEFGSRWNHQQKMLDCGLLVLAAAYHVGNEVWITFSTRSSLSLCPSAEPKHWVEELRTCVGFLGLGLYIEQGQNKHVAHYPSRISDPLRYLDNSPLGFSLSHTLLHQMRDKTDSHHFISKLALKSSKTTSPWHIAPENMRSCYFHIEINDLFWLFVCFNATCLVLNGINSQLLICGMFKCWLDYSKEAMLRFYVLMIMYVGYVLSFFMFYFLLLGSKQAFTLSGQKVSWNTRRIWTCTPHSNYCLCWKYVLLYYRRASLWAVLSSWRN